MDRTYHLEHHINHGHHVFLVIIKRGFTTETFIIPGAFIAIAVAVAIGITAIMIASIRSKRKRRIAAK